MDLQMLGEHVDRCGEDCDLHLGRTGVVGPAAVFGGDLGFAFFSERHETNSLLRMVSLGYRRGWGPSRRPGYHSRRTGGEATLLAQSARCGDAVPRPRYLWFGADRTSRHPNGPLRASR